MRRAPLSLLAALAALLGAVGCDGDDAQGPESREVTTTRVQVIEGLGRDGGFDPGQIYERLAPGVVTIISIFGGGTALLEDGGEGGQGSGFVLDDQGYVATNAHVVTTEGGGRAEQVFVEFSDGNRVPAEIVGADPNADVALLKVDPDELSLTPLELGASESIRVGEPVAAIGSPFGERQSLTIGVVSAIDRNIQSLTRFSIGNAIQTDAAINPGNSGGPLLDGRGRVIGINAQIKSQSGGGEGVGFAIPVDAVQRSLRELRADGRVSYGYLGVTTVTVWPQLAERLDLEEGAGALVQEVEADSPADDAGLRAGREQISFQGNDLVAGGDLVLAVDGRELTRENDLADVISSRSSGDAVELAVLRDGKRRTLEVELGRRPAGDAIP
ncbi:MAG TPA: trypsin-like peptidase domain-containing protein [Thermoleophilaceae bacterium]|nr:trypsin-like peptidase domain-containing protein [Thermoleophilaceae bacterium]